MVKVKVDVVVDLAFSKYTEMNIGLIFSKNDFYSWSFPCNFQKNAKACKISENLCRQFYGLSC